MTGEERVNPRNTCLGVTNSTKNATHTALYADLDFRGEKEPAISVRQKLYGVSHPTLRPQITE